MRDQWWVLRPENPYSVKKRLKKPDLRNPLSQERGTIVKDWGGRIPVCIVFPNSYYIGMSNLAVHILYSTLNAMHDVVCERCFFEEGGDNVSLESGRPISAFKIIFFTLSFEIDYINIPKILRGSSITPFREGRRAREPIIVGGGICVLSNPEPVQTFFDLFLIGDIETTIPAFMEKYREIRQESRADTVDALASFEWAYDPEKVEVCYGKEGTVESFRPADFAVGVNLYRGKKLGNSAIITGGSEFSNMFLIEGTRGCYSGCPFCLLGNVYKFSHDRLSALTTETADIGIIGGGVSFHPDITAIIKELTEAGKAVHLPSLRIDEVPLEVIDLIKDGIKTLTFGIEAGNERLRRFIGKPLTDDEIFTRTEAIFDIRSFNLKLYFMIGLFGEETEDIEAIVALVKQIKHIMTKKGAKRGAVGSITVHASPFVPKPSTPFQWLPMADPADLRDKINRLKRAFGKMDNTYFTHESVKYSFIQALFSRGDRRVADVIAKLADGESITRVMRESPLNLNFYVLRERPETETFPWDFIKGRTSKKALYRRLSSARKTLAITPPGERA